MLSAPEKWKVNCYQCMMKTHLVFPVCCQCIINTEYSSSMSNHSCSRLYARPMFKLFVAIVLPVAHKNSQCVTSGQHMLTVCCQWHTDDTSVLPLVINFFKKLALCYQWCSGYDCSFHCISTAKKQLALCCQCIASGASFVRATA